MKCTLSLYTDYLLSVPKYASATGMSEVMAEELSHDKVTRFLKESYFDSHTVWHAAKRLIRQQVPPDDESGVLIVDDSICEKPYTDENAMICWHYDHSKGRSVKGINFMSLLYVHGESLRVPIEVKIIEKTEAYIDTKTGQTKYKSPQTKNEYFRQMLVTAKQQVSFKYVLGDNWFSSSENIEFITNDLKKHCIMSVECSRTVSLSDKDRKNGVFHRVDQLDQLQEGQAIRVYLRAVKKPIMLVKQVFTNKDGSQGTRFLIATDLTLDFNAITTIFKKRWKVEEYHKSLKQHAALGASPTKIIDTQANHFFASIVAFIKLETLKFKIGKGHFRMKAILLTIATQACFNTIRDWLA